MGSLVAWRFRSSSAFWCATPGQSGGSLRYGPTSLSVWLSVRCLASFGVICALVLVSWAGLHVVLYGAILLVGPLLVLDVAPGARSVWVSGLTLGLGLLRGSVGSSGLGRFGAISWVVLFGGLWGHGQLVVAALVILVLDVR